MDRGTNDLEAVIERLEFRNAKLHHHNEKIEQEIMELRKDNKRLVTELNDRVQLLRDKGAI